MKKWLRGAALALLLTAGQAAVYAAPAPTGQMEVTEAFQWIYSTDRMNYFINKDYILYAKTDDGRADFNTVYVPVLKSYDGIQVKDVVEKRRWNNLPLEGFEFLAGEAEYLKFNIADRTVLLRKKEYLTHSQSQLEMSEPNTLFEIGKLPEKSVARAFYERVLAYADEHAEDILKNTFKDGAKPEELKRLRDERLAAKKRAEKAAKEAAKKAKKAQKKAAEEDSGV